MTDSHDLTPAECEELLRAGGVGRVAFTTPRGVELVVANFAVVDDSVVLRTSEHTQLATHGVGSRLVFEVDHVDHDHHRGWSVIARGLGEVVNDPADVEHIRATWDPRPWAGGTRDVYVRIRWTELTGRRLGTGWDPLGDLPVRRVVRHS